ncbi:hypothetical protein [Streptomyces sp. NPDC002952]|uniref:hypothetical protein n=1 Tax=Streptomyces sp. NPDC002952 TaxID=3364673 RepID=UPI0036A1AC1B
MATFASACVSAALVSGIAASPAVAMKAGVPISTASHFGAPNNVDTTDGVQQQVFSNSQVFPGHEGEVCFQLRLTGNITWSKSFEIVGANGIKIAGAYIEGANAFAAPICVSPAQISGGQTSLVLGKAGFFGVPFDAYQRVISINDTGKFFLLDWYAD